jgi:hypothetical protein
VVAKDQFEIDSLRLIFIVGGEYSIGMRTDKKNNPEIEHPKPGKVWMTILSKVGKLPQERKRLGPHLPIGCSGNQKADELQPSSQSKTLLSYFGST